MSPLDAVRDAIARVVLGEQDREPVTLGTVVLRPHQVEALARVRQAIAEFGGALLADEPGLGKTFVALALARDCGPTVVTAPAALRTMWRDAAATAQVPVTFVSLESLSRRDAAVRARLVIVDEAHHAHTPSAARYARLARLAAGARTLLLTATPVRNRASELHALLALFLGPRAATLDEASLARLVVRRSVTATAMPSVVGPTWHRPPRTRDFSAALRALPPALPALDGAEARALIAMTLARCWASSLAALDVALRRRVQRGAALDAALEAGRLPTRAELRAWAIGDDAVQLAFPLVTATAAADAVAMRAMLHPHLDAVNALRAMVAPHVARDTRSRARLFEQLRGEHPDARIVAFAAHAATAEALYRAMRQRSGVALLTARGARTAGGSRPRADVLDALAAHSHTRKNHAADDITLVIATDVLSEGVNLQGASVLVHLDVPWTPAGLDQRVGRAARIGSAHECVHVHGIAPQRGAERLLALGRRHLHKHAARVEAMRGATTAERLRERCAHWLCGSRPRHTPGAAAAYGRVNGFLAVVAIGDTHRIVTGRRLHAGRWRVSDRPSDAAMIVEAASDDPAPLATDELARARLALERWLGRRAAQRHAGTGDGPTSIVRRRVLARLDALLDRSPPHARVLLAARIERIRDRLKRAVGAGAETELARLASPAEPGGEEWLTATEVLCATFAARHLAPGTIGAADDSGAPCRVATILLVVRR